MVIFGDFQNNFRPKNRNFQTHKTSPKNDKIEVVGHKFVNALYDCSSHGNLDEDFNCEHYEVLKNCECVLFTKKGRNGGLLTTKAESTTEQITTEQITTEKMTSLDYDVLNVVGRSGNEKSKSFRNLNNNPDIYIHSDRVNTDSEHDFKLEIKDEVKSLLDREIIQRAIKEYENKQNTKQKHKNKKKKHGKHRLPTMPPPPSEAARVIMEPMGAEGNFHLNASKISEHLRTGKLDSAGSLRSDKTVSKVSDPEVSDPEVLNSEHLNSEGMKNLQENPADNMFVIPTTVEIQTEEAFKFMPLTDSTPDKTRTPPKEVTFKWSEEEEKPSKKKLRKEKPHQGHFNRFNRLMQQLKENAGGSVRRVAAPTTTMQTIVYSTFRPRATSRPVSTVESTQEPETQPLPDTTTVLVTTETTETTAETTTAQTTTVNSIFTSTQISTIKPTSAKQKMSENFDYSKNRPFEPNALESSGSGEYYSEFKRFCPTTKFGHFWKCSE